MKSAGDKSDLCHVCNVEVISKTVDFIERTPVNDILIEFDKVMGRMIDGDLIP